MKELKAQVKRLIAISIMAPILLTVFVVIHYSLLQSDNIICVAIVLLATIISISFRVMKLINAAEKNKSLL